MAARVSLLVTAGPIRGQRFDFDGHDTFLFGRAPDCHARLSPDDASASRHHFLLEANPPMARLRDLGSLNGTRLNGVRHGGRGLDETPEQALRRGGVEVDLHDGDEIRVGATVIRVAIEGRTVSPARSPEDSGPIEVRPGSTIGPYAVQGLLGRGGMGAVYLAERPGDGGPVALKVMLPRMVLDEAAQEIFIREIEITRALRHPNIVELRDFGRHEGRFYFALEYCPGGSAESLRQRQGGRLGLPDMVRLAVESLDGLATAHAAGFVHRDLKPDNVLLGASGAAKLADFGLAKSFEQAGHSGMTATGMVGGSFHFMPREQLTSFRRMRPASDVWSMAATLYYLLTGEFARDFDAHPDHLVVILRGSVVPIRQREPSLPEDLAAVFDRALDDDPDGRYPTAREFADALRAVL
jgi:serine/threonine protein kinase